DQRVRLSQGESECLYELQRNGRHPAGQLVEAAVIRLDSIRRQHSVHLLSPAGKQDSDLEARSGARGADRSVLTPRQESLRSAERGQTVLDPGCLHRLGSLPLLQSPRGDLWGKAELHSKLRKGRYGHVRRNRP